MPAAALRRSPRRAARCRSLGSAPARISSRARSSTSRAAATASGSSTPRTSSSTEGRSCKRTKTECSPAGAATLPIVRRLGVIAASSLATVAVVAVAAVGARDAYYWDRPLPGVELREAQLQTPVRVDVAGRQYRIRPGEVVRVDGAATERARWLAGRTSFADRVRQLVDPSPPTLVVDPVLVARPEAEHVAADVSAALPKPRRAQVVVRGGLRVIPARPGDAVEPGTAGRVAREGLADGRADALAGACPRRAGADDRRSGGGGRARRKRSSTSRCRSSSRARRSARWRRPGSPGCSASGRPKSASTSPFIPTGSRERWSRCWRRGALAPSTPASWSTGSRCGSAPRGRASPSTAAGQRTRSRQRQPLPRTAPHCA